LRENADHDTFEYDGSIQQMNRATGPIGITQFDDVVVNSEALLDEQHVDANEHERLQLFDAPIPFGIQIVQISDTEDNGVDQQGS